MRKFRFSLEKALDARDAERMGIEIRLGQALAALERARAARRITIRQVEEQIREIESPGGCSRQIHLMRFTYLEGLQQQLLAHARIISRIEQEADAIRQDLHRALRACKSLEKLKERETTAWRQSAHREEQAMLDEAATTGFHRREMEGAV